jgi:molybdopterin synthase sulfur carrier subunit
MKVLLSSPLRSYTGGQSQVEADGATVGQLLADLERRYPGIRFRMISEQDEIREHIRIFINAERAQSLDAPVQPSDTVHIITSISGG